MYFFEFVYLGYTGTRFRSDPTFRDVFRVTRISRSIRRKTDLVGIAAWFVLCMIDLWLPSPPIFSPSILSSDNSLSRGKRKGELKLFNCAFGSRHRRGKTFPDNIGNVCSGWRKGFPFFQKSKAGGYRPFVCSLQPAENACWMGNLLSCIRALTL